MHRLLFRLVLVLVAVAAAAGSAQAQTTITLGPGTSYVGIPFANLQTFVLPAGATATVLDPTTNNFNAPFVVPTTSNNAHGTLTVIISGVGAGGGTLTMTGTQAGLTSTVSCVNPGGFPLQFNAVSFPGSALGSVVPFTSCNISIAGGALEPLALGAGAAFSGSVFEFNVATQQFTALDATSASGGFTSGRSYWFAANKNFTISYGAALPPASPTPTPLPSPTPAGSPSNSGNLYAVVGNAIQRYANPLTASGTVSPAAAMTMPSNLISVPAACRLDATNNRLYVASNSPAQILVFNNINSLSGTINPSRTIIPQGLSGGVLQGMALDTQRDVIYLTGPGNSLVRINNASTASGTVPVAELTGASTASYSACWSDSAHDQVYLTLVNTTSSVTQGSVIVLDNASTASGGAVSSRVISGLQNIQDLVLDNAGRLAVAEQSGATGQLNLLVAVANAASASGPASPALSFSTGSGQPQSLAYDPARDTLYLGQFNSAQIQVFNNFSTRTSVASPDRVISGNFSGLNSLVLDNGFVGSEGSPVPAPTPNLNGAALTRFNLLRSLAKLPPVGEDTSLEPAIISHCQWIITNNMLSHPETPGTPGFTAAGNLSGTQSNVASNSDPSYTLMQDLNGLQEAPFHALGFLSPFLANVGFGHVGNFTVPQGNIASATGINIGADGLSQLPGSVTYPILWPGNGATVDLNTYYGGEAPDPLAGFSGVTAPTSIPLIIQLGPGTVTPSVTAFSVTQQGAGALQVFEFDQTNYTNPNTTPGLGGGTDQQHGREGLQASSAVVLMCRNPLTPGATYNASVTNSGKTINWTFSVASSVIAPRSLDNNSSRTMGKP